MNKNEEIIPAAKLLQIKKDQINVLEVYKELAKTDHTIYPFLKVLLRKLTLIMNELDTVVEDKK